MLLTTKASFVQRLPNGADNVTADLSQLRTTISLINKNVPGAVPKLVPKLVSTPLPVAFTPISMASDSQCVNVSSSNYIADPCEKPSSEKPDIGSTGTDNLTEGFNILQCIVSDEMASNKREVCEVAKSAVMIANAHSLQDLECLECTDKVSSFTQDSPTSEIVNLPIISIAAMDTTIPADAQNNFETSRNILAVNHGDSTITGTFSSPICSSRPALSRKSSPLKSAPSPTKRSPIQTSQDRGSNCVSVILKSSRLSSKPARLSMVSRKLKEMEDLVSSYNPKFCHRSSPGVQVRLDYCFHLPEHARKFFKAVHKLTDSLHSIPKMVTCILLSEEELGYQHEPVLTENDLLAIQSPEYCRNIFRTSVVMRVKMKEDTVVYEFRNVTDVNRFLYNKSSSVKTRSLGLLRKNVVPKVIEMDKGFYRLYSAGPKIPDIIGEKHRFKVNGPFLLFSSKLDLFAFLVSEDAAGIDHLQFDDKYIIDVRKPSYSETESKVNVDILKICDNLSNALKNS